MKAEIRTFIIDTCGWLCSLTVAFFFFTLWLFSYNHAEAPLKEAWSISVSFLSATATISAAVIASRLFQNWKSQHSFTEQVSILSEMLKQTVKIRDLILESRVNEDLTKIILNQDVNIDNLNNSYAAQIEKLDQVGTEIMSLKNFEKIIYLLSNNKDRSPIFKVSDLSEDNLLQIQILQQDLLTQLICFYQDIFEIAQNEVLTYQSLRLHEASQRQFVVNILNNGSMFLKLGDLINSKHPLPEDLLGQRLLKYITKVENNIMEYRDKLDQIE